MSTSSAAEGDQARAEAPLGPTAGSVLPAIAGQVQARAHVCAVRSGDERVTYGELWERAGRVAAIVSAAARGGGELRVAIGLAPGADWVGCLLGIWRAAAVAVPVNLDHPPARLRLLADSADLLVHSGGATPSWWPHDKPAITFPAAGAVHLPGPHAKYAAAAGGRTACILHTSGSTGAPKPVVLPHSGLAHRITAFADLYQITAEDRIAQLAAASVDVVLWETLLALTIGGTLCVPHGRQRVPGIGLVRWLAAEQVSVATMTPTMLAALPEVTLPELRLLVVGGEALAPARFGYWIDRHQVANAYGPTEATIATHVAPHTVLHIHVREPNGHGSKRMSMFNELMARLREAVPDMVLQIGGSISFAPEDEGADAKWLSYDTRHMLAEITPRPDQVTIAINTNQMNIVELFDDEDIEGTSIAKPTYYKAYRDMVVEAGPEFYLEHLERLRANNIQPHFQLADMAQLETVERLIRKGIYNGPLVLNYVAIGGGFAGRHPADLIEFIRRVPDGAVLTIEASMRAVAPMNAIGIALGTHVRVGNEDNLWRHKGERMSSVEQVEQMVRIADVLGREIATGPEAKKIYKIGEWYSDADETLAHLGMVPNRRPGRRGPMLRDVKR